MKVRVYKLGDRFYPQFKSNWFSLWENIYYELLMWEYISFASLDEAIEYAKKYIKLNNKQKKEIIWESK